MMIKHNFQIGFILRLIGILIFPIMLICFGAIALGGVSPTQLIIADVFLKDSNNHKLAIIDAYTNKYILLDYPVDNPFIQDFSSNSRRILIGYYNLDIWDIFTGFVAHLPKDACPTGVHSERPSRFADFQNIYFFCNSESSHLFNFETYQITSVQPYIERNGLGEISFTHLSPDNQKIMYFNFDQGIVKVKLLNEDYFTQINPSGKVYYDVIWHPDSQSIFALSSDSLERYSLETKLWESVVSNLEVPLDFFQIRLLISPDGKWVTFINENNNQAYNFNIDTKVQVDLGATSYLMWWSPDSQWLIIRRDSLLFVIRPDMTEIIPFPQEDVNSFIWSPDSTKISYNLKDEEKQAFMWDFETLQQPSMIYTQHYTNLVWLPNSKAVVLSTESRQLIYLTETGEEYPLLDKRFQVYHFGLVR